MNVIQKQPILTGVSFTLVDCVGWMEGLAAALDCYNWVFREQFIIPSEVFQCKYSQHTCHIYTHTYIHHAQHTHMHTYTHICISCTTCIMTVYWMCTGAQKRCCF